MPFWKKNKANVEPVLQESPFPDIYIPENPYINFELIDGIHLDITIGWPLECDMEKFIEFLQLLNTGQIIGPQIAESVVYANKVSQNPKAIAIHNSLEPLMPNNKSTKNPDRPIVSPSKVIANHMRMYSK